ncbi:MAG TPA: thioesterase family protein [Candidatus Dormibacteraeota bacterium]|nr:thioesterase family protein [Candidatus Dormibacteraeota bacterium]
MRSPLAETDGRRSGPRALAPGATFELTRTVTEEMSARHLGSGSEGVLATPAMLALMEGAATVCVQPFLDEGKTTVGYIVNIRHLAPTGIGREATARASVSAVDGKRITFAVQCFEGEKKVGDGEHVRVVIESSAFLNDATGSG